MSSEFRPRLGFLGVGWIGRHRLEAIVRSGLADVRAIADPDPGCADAACAVADGARRVESCDELLDQHLEGIVIATPSALHAEQATRALERGMAVFCQKPVGRTAAETARVVRAAERADRLLGTDFSYRYTDGMQKIAGLVRSGALGRIFGGEFVFHNAYGPDRPWFYDPALSGGGCVMDLGIHLVDLAMWLFGGTPTTVTSGLFRNGQPLGADPPVVEDYATAEMRFESGALARLACSWRLHAGRDAVIEFSVHGTEGGASLKNRGGSFYDFVTERYVGTTAETLSVPPDAWGGRAAVEWVRRLGQDGGFDRSADELISVAAVIDRIYGRLPLEAPAGTTAARPDGLVDAGAL